MADDDARVQFDKWWNSDHELAFTRDIPVSRPCAWLAFKAGYLARLDQDIDGKIENMLKGGRRMTNKGNPHHAPKGSPQGGQFTSSPPPEQSRIDVLMAKATQPRYAISLGLVALAVIIGGAMLMSR